jgi:hypothetical protein
MVFGIFALLALLFAPDSPTFYRDVLPILQQHCQSCHRPGEIGPMPLLTYAQARSKAVAIDQMIQTKKMPPWFADPRFGHFENDPSLSPVEIHTVSAWLRAGTPAGDPHDAPAPRRWVDGWNIPSPDVVVRMPVAVHIPARGVVDYTYEIVPAGFTGDRWVQMSEIRPSSRDHVHHAVVYIRPPGSTWMRNAPLNQPFTLREQPDAHWTDNDLLLVYAPGSSPDRWPEGMAKKIPAGSDLVFQMHYTTNGHADQDQTAIGLVFAKSPPAQQVLTLQLTNDQFEIPPGEDDYRVDALGTFPHDAVLLSLFPHMHLRGKRFEYDLIHDDGAVEPLLMVNYDFHWQLSYRLAQPLHIKAGTKIEAIAWYDNSRRNPHNPDPEATVHWGDQTSDEMMVGFFDVAVPRGMDKRRFFTRP